MSPEHHQPAIQRFPFPLPEHFLDGVGYRGRYQLVGLYWGGGDELAVCDPETHATGLHDGRPWLELMQRPGVVGWCVEHFVDFGSANGPAEHHLIVDRQPNTGLVAVRLRAELIVRAQRFDPEEFFG